MSGNKELNVKNESEMYVYNPGCALMLYKPELAAKALDWLLSNGYCSAGHYICCHHDPRLEDGSVIINTCAGCDKRFSTLYPGVSTISLWELLADIDSFPFPDYSGLRMSIHDACPVRLKPQVHAAVRRLLKRMNICVIETEHYGTNSICCGDSVYPALPLEQVHERMHLRAQSMPCEEVCVYCVSCIKAIHIGDKKPRYLLDLLFGEETEPQIYDTKLWHEQLERYIIAH